MKDFKIMQSADSNAEVAIWYVDGDVKSEELNDAVYAVMCKVGQDTLDHNTCRLSGERTAVELAGEVAKCIPMYDAPKMLVRINVGWISVGNNKKAPRFTCSFPAKAVFEYIAEWEGVMNLTAKQVCKFHCEGEDLPKGVELKNYKRCHGYHPTRVSYADTERRINKKFEVLGELYRSHTSEGMRKAMSVVAAARYFENMSHEWLHIVKDAMRWKLWRDYGKDKEKTKPVSFGASDFKYGPECYKQVDDAYVTELVGYVKKMIADSPKPEWPERNDMVVIKGAEKMKKKYQGKHLVDSILPRLSLYGERIEWIVAVSVGKYDNEYFAPSRLEPWVETKKKPAVKTTGTVAPKPTIEQLKAALLARLAA